LAWIRPSRGESDAAIVRAEDKIRAVGAINYGQAIQFGGLFARAKNLAVRLLAQSEAGRRFRKPSSL
jgi:hypothetical protein